MFGVHLESETLLAIDPAFGDQMVGFRSLEFSLQEVAKIAETGWLAWERHVPRRRNPRGSDEGIHLEAILGLKPRNFLEYVHLERLTTAAPPGERYRASARWFSDPLLRTTPGRDPEQEATRHRLEEEYGLTAKQLLDIVEGDTRLKTAVRGGVAEQHLFNLLSAVEGVTVEWLHADGRPDFRMRFGEATEYIECKNVAGTTYANGDCKVDFQRTRAPKGNPCGRYYARTEFGVLAACTHAVSGKWEFLFINTRNLAERKKCPGRLDPNVRVGGRFWATSALAVLSDSSDGS